jgi:AraC-like DNA-binding protein
MFLSPGHFSELFSREVGMPPATYLRRLRLERAQTLLRTTALSATEIAQQSGFNDLAQLSRAFRTAFNTTPSAYRAHSMRGYWMDGTAAPDLGFPQDPGVAKSSARHAAPLNSAGAG